jgi:hypothetical protein
MSNSSFTRPYPPGTPRVVSWDSYSNLVIQLWTNVFRCLTLNYCDYWYFYGYGSVWLGFWLRDMQLLANGEMNVV